MKKNVISATLLSMLLLAGTSTFTSCNKYDDDITNLQEQITANAAAIEASR